MILCKGKHFDWYKVCFVIVHKNLYKDRAEQTRGSAVTVRPPEALSCLFFFSVRFDLQEVLS